MSKYSVLNPDRFPGSEPPPFMPCDFYDAQGKLIDRWIVCADTDTGEVISQDRDEVNRWILLDPDHGEIVHRYEVFPAPLTVRECVCPKGKFAGVSWEMDEGLPLGDFTTPDGTVRKVVMMGGPRRWTTRAFSLPGGGEIRVRVLPEESHAQSQ